MNTFWQPAEFFTKDKLYNESLDIQQLGILLYFMSYNFTNNKNLEKAFESLKDSEIPEEYKKDIVEEANFILKLTNKTPENRPEAQE